MIVNDVSSKAISCTYWTFLERFGALGIQFLVTMVLARILLPGDFGLVGMLSLFTAVGSLLLDSGFSHALIQKENVSDDDYSTVFTVNVIVGIILYLLLFFAAPLIAWFLEKSELLLLSRVVFLMFLVNSACVVPLAKMTRELQFRKIACVGISSALFSGVVGLLFAASGMGIWSLVAQQLGLYVSRLLLYWCLVHWHPTILFSLKSFLSLWRYSANLLYASIVSTTFDNIYVFLVGKFFSVTTQHP